MTDAKMLGELVALSIAAIMSGALVIGGFAALIIVLGHLAKNRS